MKPDILCPHLKLLGQKLQRGKFVVQAIQFPAEHTLIMLLFLLQRLDFQNPAIHHSRALAAGFNEVLYLTGEGIPKDVAKAVEYLTDAAEQDDPQAQYILGKLYLLGSEVTQDRETATQWFTAAADQGHEYAQFFLNRMEQNRDPSVLLCATRLLCSIAQIIRDTPPPAPPAGLRIDRKRFRQLMEKKIAMGHKPDDHEEQGYIGPAM